MKCETHILQPFATFTMIYDKRFALTVRIRKSWTLGFKLGFSFAKIGLFFPVFILLLFSQSFSAKTKCKFEFPDYSSCGLIMSKLNQSVHAFLIHTVKFIIDEAIPIRSDIIWQSDSLQFVEVLFAVSNISPFLWLCCSFYIVQPAYQQTKFDKK